MAEVYQRDRQADKVPQSIIAELWQTTEFQGLPTFMQDKVVQKVFWRQYPDRVYAIAIINAGGENRFNPTKRSDV